MKLKRFVSKRGLLFWLLLVINPLFWCFISNLRNLFSELISIPQLVSAKANSIFALYNLRYILELRSGGDLFSRILFNKLTLLVNDMSKILTIISPKTYFVDNHVFGKYELIHFIFIPFWFVGIYSMLKNREFILFVYLITSAFLVYLSDQINAVFLTLPALVNLFIVYKGISYVYEKK